MSFAVPMRVARRLLPVLMLAFWAATLTGCAGFQTVANSMFMMSPQEEQQLGQEAAKQLGQQLTFVQDPQVNNYVRDLGQRIWANANQGPIAPQFFVVKNDELNAFAIPGGNVYVYTGLIEAADNEPELAAVLAHELGHVALRHGAQHVSTQKGLDFVQQAVLGDKSGQATQLVASLLESGIMTRYSRQDESDADTFAVNTLYRMGEDPSALRTFFQKLEQKYGDQGGPVAAFFADHPPTSERMQHVKNMVDQLPQKQYDHPVTELRRVQARLKQLGL